MPGVLMLEALAQAAALLAFDKMGITPDDKTVYYFAGIDGARVTLTTGEPLKNANGKAVSIELALSAR